MPLTEDEKAELVAYPTANSTTGDASDRSEDRDQCRRARTRRTQAGMGCSTFAEGKPIANFTNRTMERLQVEKAGGATTTAPMPSARPWLSRVAWAAVVLVALGGGYLAATRIWPGTPTPEPIPEDELPLVRHLRIAEKWRLYEYADDLDFVRKLNHPDLFGDDPS